MRRIIIPDRRAGLGQPLPGGQGKALRLVLAVYRDAKVEDSEQGLTLHPSRPPSRPGRSQLGSRYATCWIDPLSTCGPAVGFSQMPLPLSDTLNAAPAPSAMRIWSTFAPPAVMVRRPFGS